VCGRVCVRVSVCECECEREGDQLGYVCGLICVDSGKQSGKARPSHVRGRVWNQAYNYTDLFRCNHECSTNQIAE